ncbi:MAG: hypothetical protein CYG60_16280 [Actinobacteria bacterium]|nr:MAG: hypothetical protein CYG60_16280 [Actinomycetota bacterium]
MGEGPTERRTHDGHTAGNTAGGSGWTTTDVAARALGVSPRSVRRFIDRGDLEGRKVKEGIVEAWEVSIDSLQALRDRRGPEGRDRRNVRRESELGPPPDTSADMADLIRDLTTDLVRTASEATELRVRLELTERTESTLREELGRERARREEAERRLAELERRPAPPSEAPQEPRDAPQTDAEASGGTDAPEGPPGAQEGARVRSGIPERPTEETARRPWWVRIFGG